MCESFIVSLAMLWQLVLHFVPIKKKLLDADPESFILWELLVFFDLLLQYAVSVGTDQADTLCYCVLLCTRKHVQMEAALISVFLISICSFENPRGSSKVVSVAAVCRSICYIRTGEQISLSSQPASAL